MLSLILKALGTVVAPAAEAYKNHQTIKDAKNVRVHELKTAELTNKLEQIKQGSLSDMKMDEDSNQRIAWADDVSFIVFLVPCLFAFYPPAVPHIMAGFKTLESMPQWYQIALGMMLVSVWGYRRIVTPIIQMIAKTYLGVKSK